MITNRIIYLCGSDGSGKTTLLNDVEFELNKIGHKTHHVWLRSPKILSKPLMAYCRLLGLTQYRTIDGDKYGEHLFEKSKLVSYLYPILQILDFKIKWGLLKFKIKKDDVVLFDRFALDTLVDLMVSTKRFDLLSKKVGRSFLKMLPKHSEVFVVDVEESTIRMRKKDTLHDPSLALKIKAYAILADTLGYERLDNNRGYELVKDELLNYIGLDK